MNDPTVSITVKVKEIADKKHEMIDDAIYGYLKQVVEENNIDIDLYMNREAILEALYTYSIHPLKHGKWIEKEGETYLPVEEDDNGDLILHKYTYYECDQCGRTENKREPYCHCGAKMDKED